MASYTMELKNYIEMFSQYDDTLPTREKIEIGRERLFDFEYPIFNEDYRKTFETNFIRKFYMREIGFETEGLFKFNLETWLLIHMPYFNRMFESELIEYDPLINSKVDVVHNKINDKNQNDTRNLSGISSSTGSNTSNANQQSDSEVLDDQFNRSLDSNNPDSRLAITSEDGVGVIEYASSIKENKDIGTKNSSGLMVGTSDDASVSDANAESSDILASNINDVEDFIQSRVGKIGVQSYSKMVMEYRLALIRVEKTLFDEMNELFMLVY